MLLAPWRALTEQWLEMQGNSREERKGGRTFLCTQFIRLSETRSCRKKPTRWLELLGRALAMASWGSAQSAQSWAVAVVNYMESPLLIDKGGRLEQASFFHR
jgi:hypothetical protein